MVHLKSGRYSKAIRSCESFYKMECLESFRKSLATVCAELIEAKERREIRFYTIHGERCLIRVEAMFKTTETRHVS